MKTTLEALLAAEAARFMGHRSSTFGADVWEDHRTRRPETLFRPRQVCPKTHADGTVPPSHTEVDFEQPGPKVRAQMAPVRVPCPAPVGRPVPADIRAHSRSLSKVGDVCPKPHVTRVQGAAVPVMENRRGWLPGRVWDDLKDMKIVLDDIAKELETKRPVQAAAKPLWPNGLPKQPKAAPIFPRS